MNILTIADEERQMIVDAEAKYGRYYVNARQASLVLSNLVSKNTVNCEMFMRFFTQVKKFHTLALFSAVRRHRLQTQWNLRTFYEASVDTAYALVHTDPSLYFNSETKQPVDPQKARARAYKWLEEGHPASSTHIKEAKDRINDHYSHASVTASHNNFVIVPNSDDQIWTPFFDREDVLKTQVELWSVAQAGLIVIDLLITIQKAKGGFELHPAVNEFGSLTQENNALLAELVATPRWQAATREADGSPLEIGDAEGRT
jgi:hypothetical protein